MGSIINSLIASLQIEEIPSGNDLTVRSAVEALVASGNVGVAVERQVTVLSALTVAERSLVASVDRNLEVRVFNALRDVQAFISLSTLGQGSAVNVDLLPTGHPLSSASHSLNAEQLRRTQAAWVAADSRIGDAFKPLVATAFSAEPFSIERKHAFARMGALTAGAVPVELLIDSPLFAVTAAVGDGNDVAAKRARVKLQWRDRFGRWIEMGRGIKFKVRDNNGNVTNAFGTFVGGTANPGFGRVLVKANSIPGIGKDTVFLVSSKNGQEVVAHLTLDQLKSAKVDLGKDIHGNTVADRADKDVQNLSDIQTLEPTALDYSLAKGKLSAPLRSASQKAQLQSPIAKLPAGAEVEVLPEAALKNYDALSFSDKVKFFTGVDPVKINNGSGTTLVSDTLAKVESGEISGKEAAKEFKKLPQLIAGTPNADSPVLADAIAKLSDHFANDYSPELYASDEAKPIADLSKVDLSVDNSPANSVAGKDLIKKTEKVLGRDLTHEERVFVRGLTGYGSQDVNDAFMAEVSANNGALAKEITDLRAKVAGEKAPKAAEKAPVAAKPAVVKVDSAFDADLAKKSEDYVDGYSDGFDSGWKGASSAPISAKDGWSQEKVDAYNAGVARAAEVDKQVSDAVDSGDFGSDINPTVKSEIQAAENHQDALDAAWEHFGGAVWSEIHDGSEGADWAPEASKVIAEVPAEDTLGPRFTAWDVPDNAWALGNDSPYQSDGILSEIAPDATDDPKQLALMFSKDELSQSLADSLGNFGEGLLAFKNGEQPIPAEALYDALREQGVNPDLIVADAYDYLAGGSKNRDAVEAFQATKGKSTQIDALDQVDLGKASSKVLNTQLAADEVQKANFEIIQGMAINTDPNDVYLSQVVDAIEHAKGGGPKNKPYDTLLSDFLPWAFSEDKGKQQAARALFALMTISDGGDYLTSGTLVEKFVNSEFYNEADGKSPVDALSEVLNPDGFDYEGFLRSKARIAQGTEDPMDDASFAGSAYRLAAMLSVQHVMGTKNVSESRNGVYGMYQDPMPFQRGVMLNSDSELFKTYTTPGSVISMDLRPFSTKYSTAAQYAGKTDTSSGLPDGIIFTLTDNIDGVSTKNLSPYTNESEILALGQFKVVDVTSTPVGTSGRQVHNVTIERIDAAKPEQVAEVPAQKESSTDVSIEAVADLSGFTEVPDTQQGSNKGGLYKDASGKQIYVKFPKSELHGDNEVLASAFYEQLGIPAARIRHGKLADGSAVIFSEWVPGSVKNFPTMVNNAEYRKKVQEGFAVDAWLANWDVAGEGFDNIITDANGEPVRVDPGGALLFRAKGASKGAAFGDKVGELDTFVDGSNQYTKKTFGSMSEADKKASAERLLQMDDYVIDALVNYTISDFGAAQDLSSTLKARRDYILNHYGLKSPAATQDEPVVAEPENVVNAPAVSGAKPLTGYDVKQTSDGKNYVDKLSTDDLHALRDGSALPPALPFIVGNPNSANTMYFDSNGTKHWGQFGAAGAVVRTKDENGTVKYLLVKRSDKASTGAGVWAFPGGSHDSLSDAEAPGVTSKRELSEELGWKLPSDTKPSASYSDQLAPDWAYGYDVLDVSPNAVKSIPTKLSGEITQAIWVDADHLKSMLEDGQLHAGMTPEVLDKVLATADGAEFSPVEPLSSKWWTPEIDPATGEQKPFVKSAAAALQQGDIVTVEGTSGMRDVVVTSHPVVSADGKKVSFEIFNPFKESSSSYTWGAGAPAYILRGNESAKKFIKPTEAPTPETPLENAGGVQNFTVGVKGVDIVVNSDTPDGSVHFSQETGMGTATLGTITPVPGGKFDVYVSLDSEGNPAKAVFDSAQDAKNWVAEMISNRFGDGKNFMTGEDVGNLPKVTVHQKGFLNDPSPAQLDALNKMLATKDISPEFKQEVTDFLSKSDIVAGEVGAYIGKLKAAEDLPPEKVAPKVIADPAVDENFTPDNSEGQITPTDAFSELDPAQILAAIKASYPNSSELENGDVVIGTREYTTKYGKTYNYELIVRRTKNERFFGYVREVDAQTGDVRVLKVTKEGHSYKTMMAKLAAANKNIINSEDPRNWFTKNKSKTETVQAKFDISSQLETLLNGTHDQKGLTVGVVDLISDLTGDSFHIDAKVLDALKKSGISSSMHELVVEKMIESKIKAAASIPDYMLNVDGSAPDFPHVSYNGVQVKVGDYVDWTDIKTGEVHRGVVKHVKYNHASKDYVYSDQTLVEFPTLGNQRWRVSSNLIVVAKDAPMSAPFYAKKEEYLNPESVLTPETPTAPVKAEVPTPAEKKVEEPVVPATEEPSAKPVQSIAPIPKSPVTSGYPVSTDAAGNTFVEVNGDKVPTYADGIEVLKAATFGPATPTAIKDLQPGQLVYTANNEILHVIATGNTANGVLRIVTYSPTYGQVHIINVEPDNIFGASATIGASTPDSPLIFGSVDWHDQTSSESMIPVADPYKVYFNGNDAPIEVVTTNSNVIMFNQLASSDGKVKAESGIASISYLSGNEPNGFYAKVHSLGFADYYPTLKDAKAAIQDKLVENHIKNSSPASVQDDTKSLVSNLVDAGVVDPTPAADVVDAVAQAVSNIPVEEDGTAVEAADIYGGLNVKKISADQIHTKGGKKALFTYLKAVAIKDVQVGDIIRKGVGANTRYLQITEVNVGGKRGMMAFRIVAPLDGHYGWKDGIESSGWYYGNEKVFRPTAAFTDYFKKSDQPVVVKSEKSEKTVYSGVFTDTASVTSAAISKKSAASFAAVGITGEISNLPYSEISYGLSDISLWKEGFDSIKVPTKDAKGNTRYIIPGGVVTASDGSTGVVTDTDKANKTASVQWLTGDQAGTTVYGVDSGSLVDTEFWMTPEMASKAGVSIASDKIAAGKKTITDKLAQLEKQHATTIAEKAAQAAYNKLKKQATVKGTGSDVAPTVVPQNWSESAFPNVPSLEQTLNDVQGLNGMTASFGREVLVDAGNIEDNTVVISRVATSDGTPVTKLNFALTSWTTDGDNGLIAKLKAQDTGSQGIGITYLSYKADPSGLYRMSANKSTVAEEAGSYNVGKGNGYTYTTPVLDESGNEIGRVKIFRADSSLETPSFVGVGTTGSQKPLSFHNKVEIIFNSEATPEQISLALKTAGVADVRPASTVDLQIAAENRIIALFGDLPDGTTNVTGELRKQILGDVKDKYGFTAQDMEAKYVNGEFYFTIPESAQGAVADATNFKTYLRHGFKPIADSPSKTAEWLYQEFVLGEGSGGIRSAADRALHGIYFTPGSGDQDVMNTGGNYIFMGKNQTGQVGTDRPVQFYYDGQTAISRLGIYGNPGDAWGKLQGGQLSTLSNSSLSEVLVKGEVAWGDLSFVGLQPDILAATLAYMAKMGVTNINGIPVDQFFVSKNVAAKKVWKAKK